MSSEITSAAVSGNDAAETAQPDAEIDESLIPIFTNGAIGGDESIEDDDEDAISEAGEDYSSQPASLIKRKNKSKGFMARGPTALPKNRGNGFEGTIYTSLELRERFDAELQ